VLYEDRSFSQLRIQFLISRRDDRKPSWGSRQYGTALDVSIDDITFSTEYIFS
jgi:hypothetical protein